MVSSQDGSNVTFLLGAATEITAHVNLGVHGRLHPQTATLMFGGPRQVPLMVASAYWICSMIQPKSGTLPRIMSRMAP